MTEPVLVSELKNVLPKGMVIPDALYKLYEWIEQNGFLHTIPGNTIISGYLWNTELLFAGTDFWAERYQGVGDLSTHNDFTLSHANIRFEAIGNKEFAHWMGKSSLDPHALDRLCCIASSDGNGSRVALWLDDDNQTRVVFYGSGSGSSGYFTIGENALDFLKLLCIGYSEIGEIEDVTSTPNARKPKKLGDSDYYYYFPYIIQNDALRSWVTSEFNAIIPSTAQDIIRNHDSLISLADQPEIIKDPFHTWVIITSGAL